MDDFDALIVRVASLKLGRLWSIPATEPPPLPEDQHQKIVAGLLSAASKRPVSWEREEPHFPSDGACCFRCGDQQWWSDNGGKRWTCSTCQPPQPREGSGDITHYWSGEF